MALDQKRIGRPPIYSKDERKLRDKEGHKRRRLALQAEVNALKHKLGCVFCGTKEGKLEFHHPNGAENKYSRISNIQPKKKLIAELEKVVVLCSVCHRVGHAVERKRDEQGRFIHCS